MSAIVEGDKGFYLSTAAKLIDADREVASEAWFASHLKHAPERSWLVGRFVEAGSVNKNGHLFSVEGLQTNKPSIVHAPMNINHQSKRIVGAFVAAEMMYPTGAPETASYTHTVNHSVLNQGFLPTTANQIVAGSNSMIQPATPVVTAAAPVNPHIEALGVVWKHVNPSAYAEIELAHAEGICALSMECVPAKLRCAGEDGCGESFAYAGRQHDSYCEHLNEAASIKELIDPHFVGGAVVVPPETPAWSDADVYTLVANAHAMAKLPEESGVEAWKQAMDQVLSRL